jgi:hypothetical protein
MFTSRTNNLRLLKIAGIVLLFLLITIYAGLKSLNYARGPEINILYPTQGTITSSTSILVTGQAFRINKITLNGNPISIDENGNWEHVVIIFPGLNPIKIYAEDQFGRNTSTKLDIVGTTNQ